VILCIMATIQILTIENTERLCATHSFGPYQRVKRSKSRQRDMRMCMVGQDHEPRIRANCVRHTTESPAGCCD
jgi:hypothetical protein